MVINWLFDNLLIGIIDDYCLENVDTKLAPPKTFDIDNDNLINTHLFLFLKIPNNYKHNNKCTKNVCTMKGSVSVKGIGCVKVQIIYKLQNLT
jgi:hypothetical protein